MARLAAWNCLRSGSPTPLREVERAARERGLDARDRALARVLVGTEVRRRGTLRALVRHFSHAKPSADLAAHLHLGLVQLCFLDRIPARAAVSETAECVRRSMGPAKVRTANAILRSLQRALGDGKSGDPRRDLVGRELHLAAPVFHDPGAHPLLWCEDALSMPAPLMRRWESRLGPAASRALATLFLAEPWVSVRVVHGEREELALELGGLVDLGEPVRGEHPSILAWPPGAIEALLASDAFTQGRITIQGESALRAAELVEAQDGERVLDLCAAPGGKTAVLAGAGARVVACDVEEHKLAALAATLARLGLSAAVELRLGASAAEQDEPFDAVLVDAPCSNTGVLGARPGARWRYGKDTLRSLGELQRELFERAAALVRPGGRLVWSTCSLEPEENERLVRERLALHPELELEEERARLPGQPPAAIDGGYAARLRRRTS